MFKYLFQRNKNQREQIGKKIFINQQVGGGGGYLIEKLTYCLLIIINY